MKFLNSEKILVCIFISIMVVPVEPAKVIFARNSKLVAVRAAERERLLKERESQPVMGTIINIPSGCKPGFVFESTFHNRCRKIVT